MRIHRLVACTTAAALLSLVVPTTTATAVTYVDASAQDVTVKYNDCKSTPVEVTGDWDADYSNEIRIVVRNPNRRWFDGRTVYDDFDGAVGMSVRLCGYDKPGRYRVRVVAIGYDESFNETSRLTTGTSFRYRHIDKARSRINYRVRYDSNRQFKYMVPGRLLRNSNGHGGARVKLQVRISGYWYQAARQRTDRRGYFAWGFKPNARLWRYTYPGNSTTKPTTSDTFRTPFRGSRRVTASAVESTDVAKLFARPVEPATLNRT